MRTIALSLAFIAAFGAAPARAAVITVANVGPIANQSVSLPAEKTPGLATPFDAFFEFTLPTRETVTLSMTDSATGFQRVTAGALSLNFWTSTGPGPLFIPSGALIESSAIVNFVGGQGADVTPDALAAGPYFAEVSGVSGLSPLKIAVDSTLTATAIPEASTWAMLAIGAVGLGLAAHRRRQAAI